MSGDVDILMVTYDRAEYTRITLNQLLDTSTEGTRIWIWHNGNHQPTLNVVRSYLDHPRLFRFHHSNENKKLREPTNWFLTEAEGPYLAKVDDDLLMPAGWIQRIVSAYQANPDVGVLGTWPFMAEDIRPELAERKVVPLQGGDSMMLNCWVGGNGVVVKKELVKKIGLIRKKESFPRWMMRACAKGYNVGWLYPFIVCENLDDPRSEFCRIKTDEDAKRYAGLSNQVLGLFTVEELVSTIREQAIGVQMTPYDIRQHIGPRAFARRVIGKVGRVISRHVKERG
ncbi:MAG: glycosyltransferase family 2 protein [Candidatus Hydrogenedentes bacterium]|nr:glycosyltransferase family 2 protein [Candidatus Hydrogenedentota bacterium]